MGSKPRLLLVAPLLLPLVFPAALKLEPTKIMPADFPRPGVRIDGALPLVFEANQGQTNTRVR